MLGSIDVEGIMDLFLQVAYQPSNPSRVRNTMNFVTSLVVSPELVESKIPIGVLLTQMALHIIENEKDKDSEHELFMFFISTFIQMDVPCFIHYESIIDKEYLIPVLDLYHKKVESHNER